MINIYTHIYRKLLINNLLFNLFWMMNFNSNNSIESFRTEFRIVCLPFNFRDILNIYKLAYLSTFTNIKVTTNEKIDV